MADYQTEWRRYRVRRRWLTALLLELLLGFIGFLGFIIFTPEGRNCFPDTTPSWLALCWFALFTFTASRSHFFPCPRCGESFRGNLFSGPKIRNESRKAFWGQACAHCGLPKSALIGRRSLIEGHRSSKSLDLN